MEKDRRYLRRKIAGYVKKLEEKYRIIEDRGEAIKQL